MRNQNTEAINANGIKFSDSDIVNPDEWIPEGEYNPHKVRPFLFHDHGFVLCIVFASCEQDALVDAGKLERYAVNQGDYPNEEGLSFLGNASEPFGLEGLGIVFLSVVRRPILRCVPSC